MSTIVSFHAHPDDESILCGGTLAKAAKEGHRVVLVTATRGEHGEVPAGFLSAGETLGQRREIELRAAARILGVNRVEFLGYVDSGMRDEPTNSAPGAFWGADIEEAAERLAKVLLQEDADVLTVYDSNGAYGHPDHIQVHQVGVRAARIARTPFLFEATLNREHVIALRDSQPEDQPAPPDIGDEIGLPATRITTTVDVTNFLETKRSAMAAHRSQMSDESFFLSMPPEQFRVAFGTEWFRQLPTDFGGRSRSENLLSDDG
ncbi:MAG TPA: PIG-L family deacetylase [Acidimicrobiales bacterium]